MGTNLISAQKKIGVVWDIPQSENEIVSQLNQFSELGIDVLETNHPIKQNVLNRLSEYDFQVFVRSKFRFLTLTDVKQHLDELTNSYRDLGELYNTDFFITDLGLLTNSQVFHPDFDAIFSPRLDSLTATTNKALYFFFGDEWFYFDKPSTSFARLITDDSYSRSELITINSELSDFQNDDSELLFISSTWLLNAINDYPELKNSLINYQKTGNWLFPLPQVSKESTPANWMVLLLFALWVSLAVQLKHLPISRAMISRYFLSHRFYADDILHYRERSGTGSFTLLIQHVFFSGLVFYLMAQILLSDMGIEAFFYHLPVLAITGSNYFSFFFLGMLLALIIPFVSLIWLHFASKSLEHFSQTLNLYSGIFFLDFILVTIMLTLFLAGSSSYFIIILGMIFFLCWFAAFYIAAGDASKHIGSGKILYLFLTVGLHTIAVILLIILIVNSPKFIEVLDLAVSL